MEYIKEKKGLIFGAIITLIIFFITSLVSIIIGGINLEHTCQTKNNLNLSLANWLIGYGIYNILLLMTTIVVVIIIILIKKKKILEPLSHCLIILNIIFGLIYNLIGFIILIGSIICINDGTTLGVMAAIMMFGEWFILIITGVYMIKP